MSTVKYGSLPIKVVGCPHCGVERNHPCRNRDGSVYRPSHRKRQRALAVLVRVVDALELGA